MEHLRIVEVKKIRVGDHLLVDGQEYEFRRED
ncbi:Protein of unknown function [Lactobacillus helveticus CIRM-BIA 104]|uniref:Uncharacterized protein n=1 Tax=Lactobacillus helveticus CIRM-BIA 104 TaxID=1226333 RepID=U6FBF8_LACHE|nr:Protein of unknown function [Lactobacillus helveticus CIRM-BIA 104]